MFVPLTPLRFLHRAIDVFGHHTSIVSGDQTFTYAQFGERCQRLAAALEGLGVQPGDRIAYMALALEMNGYDADRAARFFDEARLRLEALPQVEGVTVASRIPLSLNNNGFGVFIDGHQSAPTDRPYGMDGSSVDERYADVLGLTMVSGRWITPADRDERRRVAVVTSAMAERYWPGEDVIGREFRLGWGSEPHAIVGVVEDYRVDTPGESPKPYLHLPASRQTTYGHLMVRTQGSADPLVSSLEREMRASEPDLVFMDTGTMRVSTPPPASSAGSVEAKRRPPSSSA
jgi:hypothetical protein